MGVDTRLSFTNGFPSKKSDELFFLSDGGIEGSITIQDKLGCGYDLVKISLEGVLVNSIRHSGWPSTHDSVARKLQVLLRMSDVKKRSEFMTIDESGETVARCSFRFRIPECLGRNLLGEDSEYLSDLPASLNHSEIHKGENLPTGSCLGESCIHYTVRADVLCQELVVGSARKIVKILPTLKPRPPICLADFGKEYTPECSKSMRGNGRMAISKIGKCKVEAVQPEPVILTKPGDPITILVPLKFTLRTTGSATSASRRGQREQLQFRQQCESILSEECKCTAALVSSTYVSVLPRQNVPALSEATKSPNLTRMVSVCSRTTTTLIPSINSTQQDDSTLWHGQMMAKLIFDKFRNDGPLIPSFDSSMISYRYRLALKVHLNPPSRMNLVLEVPITVHYHSNPSSDEFEYPTAPAVNIDAGTSTPVSITESLEQHFASMQVQDIILDPHRQSLYLGNMDLPLYHPQMIGIPAPPYVV